MNTTSLEAFAAQLRQEEKSPITIDKYLRDAGAFLRYAGDTALSKELVLAYKQALIDHGYAVSSINSMLAAVNAFLSFLGREDCRVKNLKAQRPVYCPESRELTRAEYERLLAAAEGQPRLRLLLQTICATGIRVSELQYFTVEAARRGEITVRCKGKTRCILIPGKLCKRLLQYARRSGISGGVIFRSRTGRPLDRSNIWAAMKRLCGAAGVAPEKVFPHNLRKLFARSFYQLDRDIAKLADILGHSSINTTRIYIMTTVQEHRRELERLRLVM